MATTLVKTDFNFPGQKSVYHGKVRDVYDIDDDILVMIATDRISAFDVILPKGIPFKGQILNQIASKFLDATADIVPNWKLATPDPMVTVGLKCEGFRVEMIIRGYLTGSAWREYAAGCRELCGVKLPDGMRENERFPEPIITPTTKADAGHDENISKEEIIAQGLVSREDYEQMERYTRALFARGTEMAAAKGLILVDTKYEFGKRDGKVYLIDEIHTPDSSRYFYAEGYEERFAKGEPQRQLSKEFVSVPFRFKSTTLFKSSTFISNTCCVSVSVPPGIFPPAALTRISTLPHWANTFSFTSRKLSMSSTLQVKPQTSPPVFLSLSNAFSTRSECAPIAATLAPAFNRPSDMLLPNTPEPPVTTATFPDTSNKLFILCQFLSAPKLEEK